MQRCSRCGEIKPLSEYYKDMRRPGGHRSECKICVCAQVKKYREDNPEKIRARTKKYYKDNTEKVSAKCRKWGEDNPEKRKASSRKWREGNPGYNKKHYAENSEKLKVQTKKYYKEHIEKCKAWSKKRRERNPERTRGYMRKYREGHPMIDRLRTRLRIALKRGTKSASTLKLLGCSVEYLRERFEGMFYDGMTWANMGKWHIDHIRPCVSFDLTKSEEQRKCFHFSNLQPLWAGENIRKGASY